MKKSDKTSGQNASSTAKTGQGGADKANALETKAVASSPVDTSAPPKPIPAPVSDAPNRANDLKTSVIGSEPVKPESKSAQAQKQDPKSDVPKKPAETAGQAPVPPSAASSAAESARPQTSRPETVQQAAKQMDRPVTQAPQKTRGGFLPMMLGGAVAAAMGAGATYYALPHLPEAWRPAMGAASPSAPAMDEDLIRRIAEQAGAEAANEAITKAVQDMSREAGQKAGSEAGAKTGAEAGRQAGIEAAEQRLAQVELPSAGQEGANTQPAGDSVAAASLATPVQNPKDTAVADLAASDLAARLTALTEKLAAQDDEISALRAKVDQPSAPDASDAPASSGGDQSGPDLAALQSRLDEQGEKIGTLAPKPALESLQSRVDDLESRLKALSDRPVADPETLARLNELGEKAQGIEQQIKDTAAAAQEQIKAAEEQAAKIRAETEASDHRSRAVAAMALFQSALASGAPRDAAIAELDAVGVTVPDALRADQSPLIALRRDFAGAARAALAASLKAQSPDADTMGKITNFLRVQTGARSVEPKDGGDPDAVLSRAEARVQASDIAGALQELQSLPQAGRDAPEMSQWMAEADNYTAAQRELDQLSRDVK